jgi:hypothetical protein
MQAGWRGIVYGGHPRTVLVADARSVSLVDLRAPSQGPLLAQAPPGCIHTAMAAHPSSDWLWALGDTRRVALMDARMGRAAVAGWPLHHGHGHDLGHARGRGRGGPASASASASAPAHLVLRDDAVLAMHRAAAELVAYPYCHAAGHMAGAPRLVLGVRGANGLSLAGFGAAPHGQDALVVAAMTSNGGLYAGKFAPTRARARNTGPWQAPAVIDAAAQHWDPRRQQALAYTVHDYGKAYAGMIRYI